jgi:hypothetical protein
VTRARAVRSKHALLVGTVLSVLLAPACLRFASTPDAWSCEGDADCDGDEFCSSAGKCRDWDECDTTDDCYGGLVCEQSQCVPRAQGTCETGSDAPCIPYRCELDQCLSACSVHSECAAGYRCVQQRCQAACRESTAVSDCDGYACSGGDCKTSCQSGADCSGSRRCIDGKCVTALLDGEACASPADCESAVCCADPVGGGSICAAACASSYPGSTCRFGAECLSGSCNFGLCDACTTEECADLVCAQTECGAISGAYCGDCLSGSYCDFGVCVNACQSQACGDDHGVDCGACQDGMVCLGGLCEPYVCDPAIPYYCEDNKVFECIGGVLENELATCGSAGICDADTRSCITHPCEPGFGWCAGTRYYVCDIYGNVDPNGFEDCSAEGLSCSNYGCGYPFTDVVGASVSEINDRTNCGNIYSVSENDRLVRVTQSVTVAVEATFFVYWSSTLEGPYQLAAPPTLVTGSTSGSVTSPPLAMDFIGGRYYYIGVAANASPFYTDPAVLLPQYVSFGTLVSGACFPNGLTGAAGEWEDRGVASQTLVILSTE